MQSVYNATGIDFRYSVLKDYCKNPGDLEFFPNDVGAPFPTTDARMKIYRETALPLVLDAINNCFASQDNFNKNLITHVITVSCTGMYAPGLDIEIVQTLGLATTTKRTAINFMGCYGAFNALKVANDICKADANAVVLVVSVEISTIHFQKSMHLDNVLANALFADGAGAVIVETSSKHAKHLALDNFYCDLLPQTEKEMAWSIADSGFDIVLTSYVPQAIEKGIAKFINKFMQSEKINFADITRYAIHPGGLKILQACEKALNITEEDNRYSYEVLKNYGNMSSATILFVLKKIWDDASVKKNEKIFACAFGPGLTLEAMVLSSVH